jgi:hypothetical protein
MKIAGLWVTLHTRSQGPPVYSQPWETGVSLTVPYILHLTA